MRSADESRELGTAAATATATNETLPTRGRLSMLDKLEFMVEFWGLKARNKARGKPLSGFERVVWRPSQLTAPRES
jgi:hypothetical protein